MAAITPQPYSPVSAGTIATPQAQSAPGGGVTATPTNQQSVQDLNQALAANQQAYGGLANQNLQQYYQNAGNVQQNLVNQGLGNTTVADNMAQAPLQTYQNSMLNLVGQQQGQATGIYDTASQQALQSALANQQQATSEYDSNAQLRQQQYAKPVFRQVEGP